MKSFKVPDTASHEERQQILNEALAHFIKTGEVMVYCKGGAGANSWHGMQCHAPCASRRALSALPVCVR